MPFSIRLPDDLRTALERESDGRPIAERVIFHLRQSLAGDTKISDRFGNAELGAVLGLVAHAMLRAQASIRSNYRKGADWLDDPWIYDQMVMAATTAFRALRPNGKAVAPELKAWGNKETDDLLKHVRDTNGEWMAQILLRELVDKTDPEQQALRARLTDRLISRIAQKRGIKTIRGNRKKEARS